MQDLLQKQQQRLVIVLVEDSDFCVNGEKYDETFFESYECREGVNH